MPNNRLQGSFGKGLEYTEITYAKNVVNFSGDDKAVPAVYRSCARSFLFFYFLHVIDRLPPLTGYPGTAG
jgi:hypothetical protein